MVINLYKFDERINKATLFLIGAYHSFAMSYWKEFTSMEQLWLAFVMFERFGKYWTGTEWIKK